MNYGMAFIAPEKVVLATAAAVSPFVTSLLWAAIAAVAVAILLVGLRWRRRRIDSRRAGIR